LLSILDAHITIGRVVLDAFEDAVFPLINSTLELAVGKLFVCGRTCKYVHMPMEMYICITYTYSTVLKLSATVFTVDLNNSIISLQLVNVTVVTLQNLTQRLQMELDDVAAMLQTLDANCRNAGVSIDCAAIPTQSYSVVNYTMVRNVLQTEA